MYKIVWVVLLACISKNICAQAKEVDSLLKALDIEKIDSNKLNTLSRLGSIYMFNNASKGIEYLEKGIALAIKINEQDKLARLYILNGFCYRIKADFEKSLENYLNATRIYEKEDKRNRLGAAYISVGDVYSDTKNVPKASEYYDKAEVIILKQKDSFELSHLYFEKGILYDKNNGNDTSMQFFKKAYQIGKLLKSDMVITNALSAIGANYKSRGNFREALKSYDTVKQIYNTKHINTPDLLAALFINYGEAYLKANNFENAKVAFQKSISYATSAGLTEIEMNNYKSLATLYANINEYKMQAYYLEKFYKIKDSLYTSDTKNKLTQLEADYKIEKKNIEIVKKEAEVEKGKNQRNLFVSLAAGLLFLFGGLGFFYSRIRNKNNLLGVQNEKINIQKNELLTLNGVKDRLFSIISHDLRNPLVTLRSYLSLSDNPNISEEKKKNFKNQTVQAVVQTTDMLDNLLVWANMQIKNTVATKVPIQVEDFVLDVTDTLQAQAAQKNISILTNLQLQTIIGDKNILTIALRNLITNAIKYSHQNGQINITVQLENNQPCIKVKDDGVGITALQKESLLTNQNESTIGTQGEKGSGLGLFLVQELLTKANCTLQISSVVGVGSTFTIVIL